MDRLKKSLAAIGEDPKLRRALFDTLAAAERASKDPAKFRHEVRWPILEALLRDTSELVKLRDGLVFEIWPQSRIEKAVLLSLDASPDHIWEPQTTRLACALAKDCTNVVVGGAYIGDQALPVAKVLQSNRREGLLYAFEPHPKVFKQLIRHIEINRLANVKAEKLALWERSGIDLQLQGGASLTSAFPDVTEQAEGEAFTVPTVALDEYLHRHHIDDVGLIMLDTEGAEETALAGAKALIGRPGPRAPHIIFEVYSRDWSRGLADVPLIGRLVSLGYEIFAIRDLQGNLSLANRALEIIPLNDAYIANVPHGFNVLATKHDDLAGQYGLTVVKNLSPKLLSDKDTTLPYPPKIPALHLPQDGLGLDLF